MAAKIISKPKKVAMIGSGSFGTAIAKTIALNGHSVNMLVRDKEMATRMQTHKRNPKYLVDIDLPDSISYDVDINNVITGADLIMLAVPSHASMSVIDSVTQNIQDNQTLVSTIKGVIDDESFLISRYIEKSLKQANKKFQCAVISGPNLAKEIAQQQHTGTVIAGQDNLVISMLENVLCNEWLSVHTSDDVVGVELGGALKNIYAISAGMIDHLGMGDNCKSLLLANGMFEIIKFSNEFGAHVHTLCGLSGIGDLITTCISPLSRNYKLGSQIATGKKLDEAQETLSGIAEGLGTLQLVHKKALEMSIDLPIVTALHAVLYEDLKPKDFVNAWLHNQTFLHT